MMGREKKPSMAAFKRHVKDIALRVAGHVQHEMGKREWVSAYLDMRGDGEPGCQLAILRIVAAKGSQVKTVKPPSGVAIPMGEIWDQRDAVFTEKWFGLKVTVYPDGKHETEFNHDPNCVMDPKFLGIED